MFYRFDIEKWVLQVLPPVLRKPVLHALVKALIYPLKVIYGAFLVLKRNTDRTLSANAFTGALQHHLNRLFYLPEGTIRISDHIDEDKVYIAFREEVADTIYMSNENDLQLSSKRPAALRGVFVINIPESFNKPENIARITLEANYYKYAGTEFIIKTY